MQWTCLPADAVPSVSAFQQMLDLKGGFFSTGFELLSHKQNPIVTNSQMTAVSLKTFAADTFLDHPVDVNRHDVQLT